MHGRGTRVGAHWALVTMSFLVLACLVFWPVAPWSNHVIVDCACQDPAQEVWFLHWTSWAVLHGHNPFFTSYLHVPGGANLALNTSFPLLGLLALPVTATAGPLVSYNLLLRLALALSALAMYGVLRRYTRWWLPAYAGGLVYGFSAYMIGHSHRHLFLTFVPLLPLIVPVVDDWLVTIKGRPWRSGALLGLLIGAEFLISPELAFLAAAAVGAGLVVLALRYPHEVRRRLAPAARGVVSFGATLLVVAGIPAFLLLAGPQRPRGAIHLPGPLDKFQGDLLAPILSTHGEFLRLLGGGDSFVNHSIQENGFYLGLPLLVLCVAFAIWCRRSPLVLLCAAMAATGFILGLGPTLRVNGTTVLHWMPFKVLAALPVVQNVEPARLSIFLAFGAAMVVALGLDRWDQTGVGSRYATAVVAIIAVIPLIPRVPFTTANVSVPRYFTSGASGAIPQGAIAMTFPYSRTPNDAPMLWQSASDMRFRIFGGMAFVPGPNGRSTWTPKPPTPPNIDALLLAGTKGYTQPPTAIPGLAAATRRFLITYRVGVILVDPRASEAAAVESVITRALGGTKPTRIQDMDVWLNVRP